MKAAIWTRVSTTQQETANQARQLWDMAERRGWEVVQTYQVEASAFQGAHLKALYQVAKDARCRTSAIMGHIWEVENPRV